MALVHLRCSRRSGSSFSHFRQHGVVSRADRLPLPVHSDRYGLRSAGFYLLGKAEGLDTCHLTSAVEWSLVERLCLHSCTCGPAPLTANVIRRWSARES